MILVKRAVHYSPGYFFEIPVVLHANYGSKTKDRKQISNQFKKKKNPNPQCQTGCQEGIIEAWIFPPQLQFHDKRKMKEYFQRTIAAK